MAGPPFHRDGPLRRRDARARVERGPLELAEATAILAQIAGALARAHASGIVHRDLKPANIFLVPQEARRGAGFGRGESLRNSAPSGPATFER